MPIEFAPPSAQVQPFQIAPAQYTDPLETLARMQQMRTQNIQQQNAQLQLQQAQMEMASNRDMMNAFVQGGGDTAKTRQLIMASPNILPNQRFGFDKAILERDTALAGLDEKQQTLHKNFADLYSGMITANGGPTDIGELNAINTKARAQNVPENMLMTTFPVATPDHTVGDQFQAYANSILMMTQRQAKEKAEAETAAQLAGTEEKRAATKKTGLETTDLTHQQFLRDLQSADQDPATGTPTPAATAALRTKYPQEQIPETITPQYIQRLLRAEVSPEKQPEFDLNTMKLKMGVLGNSEYDQFLVQYARALNKTPAQLTPQEGLASFQKYAEMKQDPVMRDLAIGQKNIAQALANAQLSQIPTQADIDFTARSLVDHSMSPSQFNELRSGRTAGSLGLRAFERAKELDPNFSLQRADAEFKSMEKTEEAFTTGREAQMVRSNNNLMEHLGLLDQARQALGTGNLPALRVIAQAIGTGLGSDANTTYDLIAGKVADEAAKSFIPSGGGEAERMAQANDFRRTLGNQQISSNIKGLLNLVDSQQRNLTDQYSRGTYRQMGQQLFTPQALATRDRLLGTQPAQGPGGASYQHTATGPNGHKVGSNDGKTWYDLQTGQPITPQPPATRNVQPQEPKPSPLGKPQLPSTPSAPTPSGGYFYAERKDGSIARFDSEAQYKKDKREHPELYK